MAKLGMEGALAGQAATRGVLNNATSILLNLSKRPKDYAEDGTMRGDIAIQHMVEYLDGHWGGIWWYRYFVKNRIRELERVMFELSHIAYRYSRPLSEHESRVLNVVLSDAEKLHKLDEVLQTHRLVLMPNGEHKLVHRQTGAVAARAKNIRDLMTQYRDPVVQEESWQETKPELALDPDH